MPTEDPYQVLGVNPDTPAEEVTTAYVELLTSTRDPAMLAAIEQAYAAVTANLPKPSSAQAGAASGRQSNRPEGEGRRRQREARAVNGKGNAPGQAAPRPERTPTPVSHQEKSTPAPTPPSLGEDFDPYRALNLTPKASPQQIKASYERLMSMTRRQGRRAQIERAYRMLIGESAEARPSAATAPGAAPQAPIRETGAAGRQPQPRPGARRHGPGQRAPRSAPAEEIPRPVATRETSHPVSMAEAIRQAAAQRVAAAEQEVPPEPSVARPREEPSPRYYWYIALAVLVVLAGLAVAFFTVWK